MKKSVKPSELPIIDVEITALAGLGDGQGIVDDVPIYVGATLPGDVVRVKVIKNTKQFKRGKLLEILKKSPERLPHPCTHFGTCGGCQLQHISEEKYDRFKTDALRYALSRAGYQENIAFYPIQKSGAFFRRRVEFQVANWDGVCQLGFFEKESRFLVPIRFCPILDMQIYDLVPDLQRKLKTLTHSSLHGIHITKLTHGLDIVLRANDHMNDEERAVFVNWKPPYPITRLFWEAKKTTITLLEDKPAVLHLGDVDVPFPPKSFIQGSDFGEAAILSAVISSLPPAPRRIIDLFCGLGTYSFPLLARGYEVIGYEGDHRPIDAANSALKNTSYKAQMIKRDLYEKPLTADEFAKDDIVIINPPRTGAEPQTIELAKSNLKDIIMVSCNPVTLERDAKHLYNAGYKIKMAMPIDQFTYSTFVESVVHFQKT